MEIGESITFEYTGDKQSIVLSPGIYMFEAYGASGGGSVVNKHTSASSGGLGGYTKAMMELRNKTTIYVYVGGKGLYGVSGNPYGGPLGGFNGGGRGGNSSSGSGGGATDFRIIDGNWNELSSLKSRFLVAGGAGGADNGGGTYNGSDDGSGGSGGGINGEGTWINGSYNSAYGGTQVSGGGFGYGQDVTTNTDTGGAGGGYYGGKVSNHSNGGGGGGSSYIKDFKSCDKTYVSLQGNIQLLYGEMKQGVCNGHGYAIITMINDESIRYNSNIFKDIDVLSTIDFSQILGGEYV